MVNKKGTRVKRTISKLLFLSVIFYCNTIHALLLENHNSEAISKTTLTVHPVFVSGTPELITSFRDNRNHIRPAGHNGAFQIALIGGQSVEKGDLARYFFPEGQEELFVAEDTPEDDFSKNKNLLAQNFNIFTDDENFQSTIRIGPEQTIVGVGFHYRQLLWQNENWGRGIWLSLSSPLLRVQHNSNLEEQIISTSPVNDNAADDVVATMMEALSQPAWKFGKITNRSMKKIAFADVECKLGYEWLQHKPFHMESYLGLIIPTANRPNGEFMFEPIVGRGHHLGFMFGSSLGAELWADEGFDRCVRYELTNHSEYLFQNTQTRSFDLKHKPWSRYIPVYSDIQQAQAQANLAVTNPLKAQNNSTPGINVLTQQVKVTPGFSHTVNTAFLYSQKRFQAEVGYNFFSKRAEHVKLANPWQEGPAIKHFEGEGQTNPIRTITGNKFLEQTVINAQGNVLIPVSVENYKTVLITEDQLDLESATTPCTLAHTLYLTMGSHWDDAEYPFLINGGSSYTFSKSNNATVRRWLIWFKCAVSF